MRKNTKKSFIASILAAVMVLTSITPGFANEVISAEEQHVITAPLHNTISAGGNHSAAILPDGSLWTWGNNNYGQLGNGRDIDRHAPTMIMEDVVSVSAGRYNTMAIMSDGSLWAWGLNWERKGIYPDVIYGDDAQDALSPIMIMEDVIYVSVGRLHAMAIRSDGSLWAWGWNGNGQLGNGTEIGRPNPIMIMEDVIHVSAGGYHTMAIKSDGSLWGWGRNAWGGLGNGSFRDVPTPTLIMEDMVYVSAGSHHTMAIRNDGSLWGWGWNVHGQLGDGTTTHRLSPVIIMEDVISVSAGLEHTMAIKSDGSLWGWGGNWAGNVGDGTATFFRLNPTNIMEDVISVSTGIGHTIATRIDDSVWTWGWNEYGQLGIDPSLYYIYYHDHVIYSIKTPTQVSFDPKGFIHSLTIGNGDVEILGITNHNQEMVFNMTRGEFNSLQDAFGMLRGKIIDIDACHDRIVFTNPHGSWELGIGEEAGFYDGHTIHIQGFDRVYTIVIDVAFLYGDINGDGVVDWEDFHLLMMYLAGYDVEINKRAANVTGRGEGYISLDDVILLYLYLIGHPYIVLGPQLWGFE